MTNRFDKKIGSSEELSHWITLFVLPNPPYLVIFPYIFMTYYQGKYILPSDHP